MPSSSIPYIPMISELDVSTVLWWVFAAVTIAFVVHAIVVAYHWFTFGTERITSLLSTVIYIGFGGFILLAMFVTLLAM